MERSMIAVASTAALAASVGETSRSRRRFAVRVAMIGACLGVAACSSEPKFRDSDQFSDDTQTYAGKWIVIGHDSLGHPIYVDKRSIANAGPDRKTGAVALVDEMGRMIEHVTFDCQSRAVSVTSRIGSVENSTTDLVGDQPGDNRSDGSALDYVCSGTRPASAGTDAPLDIVPPHV